MDAKRIVNEIRAAGFTLELDASGKPAIDPLKNLTAEQRELLKTHRDSIRKALEEEKRGGSLLTPFDNWEMLSAWWLGWTPPRQPYRLDSAVFVTEPQRSYEYHVDLLRSKDCYGQVQLALYDWIKRHAVKFGARLA